MSIENYPARLTTGFYRVREKWDDPSTQVGAYRILANAIIKNGVVRGDVVEYQTNFGVTLVTTGNSRNLSSFLGFRRANPDKTVTFLDEKWKVSGRNVCYTRKKLKEKAPDMAVTEEKRKKGEDILKLVMQGSMSD